MKIVKCGNKGEVLFAPDSVPFVFSALRWATSFHLVSDDFKPMQQTCYKGFTFFYANLSLHEGLGLYGVIDLPNSDEHCFFIQSVEGSFLKLIRVTSCGFEVGR